MSAAAVAACEPLVAAFEGLGDGDVKTPGLQPYWDQNGVATIGYGHTLLDGRGRQIRRAFVGDPVADDAVRTSLAWNFASQSIDAAYAATLLTQDLAVRATALQSILGATPTTDAQFTALLSLMFNIGDTAFSMSTVFARHKAGQAVPLTLDFGALEFAAHSTNMAAGIDGAFAALSHTGGQFNLGLFRRRMAETMIYRGDPVASALKVAWAIK